MAPANNEDSSYLGAWHGSWRGRGVGSGGEHARGVVLRVGRHQELRGELLRVQADGLAIHILPCA